MILEDSTQKWLMASTDAKNVTTIINTFNPYLHKKMKWTEMKSI